MLEHARTDTMNQARHAARQAPARGAVAHETEAHDVAERVSGLAGPAHDGEDRAARRLAPPRPRSAGRPLPPDVRARLSRELGADLSAVRVHDEPEVTDRADAAALAYGQDVFLGNEVDTSTPSGQYVLAHEVAHTVQQSGGGEGLSAAAPTVQRLPRVLERMLNRAQGKTNVLQPRNFTGVSAVASPGNNPTVQVKLDHKVGGTKHGVFKDNGIATPAASAVGSSRLAKGLGMRKVIARNKFAQAPDGSDDGGSLLGTHSAFVKGKQVRTGDKTKGFDYQDVDWKNPKIQKGMADLQLFDAISGQEDRHLGNIFVDEKKGRVRGIDDDMSFPTVSAPSKMVGKSNLGLPQQVDKKTAKKVMKLKAKDLPGMLRREGDPSAPSDNNKQDEFLSDGQIAAAQKRLAAVQAHVGGLKTGGQLVKKWNKNTYDAAMTAPVPQDMWGDMDAANYLHRAVQSKQEAKAGTAHETGATQRLVGVNQTKRNKQRAAALREALQDAGI